MGLGSGFGGRVRVRVEARVKASLRVVGHLGPFLAEQAIDGGAAGLGDVEEHSDVSPSNKSTHLLSGRLGLSQGWG